jgi:hypothetical protein
MTNELPTSVTYEGVEYAVIALHPFNHQPEWSMSSVMARRFVGILLIEVDGWMATVYLRHDGTLYKFEAARDDSLFGPTNAETRFPDHCPSVWSDSQDEAVQS